MPQIKELEEIKLNLCKFLTRKREDIKKEQKISFLRNSKLRKSNRISHEKVIAFIKSADREECGFITLCLALRMLDIAEFHIAKCELAKTIKILGDVDSLMTAFYKLQSKAISLDAAKKALAKMGGLAKVATDPKQQDKSLVYSCWQDWQKKLDSYKSKAEFARDMLTKCEHLTSQKKIEDWCREWEKANPAG